MTDLRSIHREAWFWVASALLIFVLITGFVIYPFAPLSSLAIAAAIIRGALLCLTLAAGFVIPMKYAERAGLVGASVGMMMTTQSLLNPDTPWEAWASIVAGGGWLMFMTSMFGPKVWRAISSWSGVSA